MYPQVVNPDESGRLQFHGSVNAAPIPHVVQHARGPAGNLYVRRLRRPITGIRDLQGYRVALARADCAADVKREKRAEAVVPANWNSIDQRLRYAQCAADAENDALVLPGFGNRNLALIPPSALVIVSQDA